MLSRCLQMWVRYVSYSSLLFNLFFIRYCISLFIPSLSLLLNTNKFIIKNKGLKLFKYFFYNDRLKYTEATLCELYRVSSVKPLGVPHAVLDSSQHVEFRGYVIPKVCKTKIKVLPMNSDNVSKSIIYIF